MSAHEPPGSGEPRLTEQDLVIAALVGRYVERLMREVPPS